MPLRNGFLTSIWCSGQTRFAARDNKTRVEFGYWCKCLSVACSKGLCETLASLALYLTIVSSDIYLTINTHLQPTGHFPFYKSTKSHVSLLFKALISSRTAVFHFGIFGGFFKVSWHFNVRDFFCLYLESRG